MLESEQYLKLRVPLQPASSSSLQFTPNYIKNPIIHKDEYYAVADEAMGRHERQQRQLEDAAVTRHKHFQDVSTSPQASAVTNSVTTSCQTPPLVRKDLSSEVLTAATGTHSGKGGGLTKILKLKVGRAGECLDGTIAVIIFVYCFF